MRGFMDDDGKAALARAIGEFEAHTAAELVVAVRPRSDRYSHVPALVGGLFAALTLAFLLYGEPEFGLHWFLIDPLVVGLVAALLSRRSRALVRWLTPRRLLDEVVLRAARASFVEHGVSETRGRTGVFVYVSAIEREAVVLADVGVRKTVPHGPWEAAARALREAVAGGARAAELSPHLRALGELCADAMPRGEDDVNELPDEVRS